MEEQTEKRSFGLERVEVREKQGELHFRGHAAVFNTATSIGAWKEVVYPGAFKRSIDEGRDVLFTLDHNPERLLARTSSGTLRLREDRKGLAVEATLPDTTYARDAAELVSRGDLSGMSFVFKPQKQTWETSKEGRQRNLHDVDLYDVSLVAMPAYPDTSVDIEMRMLMDALTEARAGAMLSSASKDEIKKAIQTLQGLLAMAEPEPRSVDPRLLKLDLFERYGALLNQPE